MYNKSNTLVQLVLSISTNQKTKIMIPSPNFSLYGLYTNIFKNKVINVPLTQNFQFNTNLIHETVTKKNANYVILCSPNNPTNYTISNGELEELLNTTNALILINKTYKKFNN